MTEVPFVDFRAHVRGIRADLDRALARVLDSGWFILGPEGEAFEKELAAYLDAKEAVAVANGTEAIQLALEALGVGKGDEVVTSPLTAAFTALAVLRAGGTPVFADLDPRTLNVDPAAVEAALTPRTKALLPVHLYGHPCDLDPLLALARKRGIPLVEDACQAVGARYRGRRVGAISGIGALSFYPTKNLGALGDGGAVVVNDPEVARRLRRLRNGGQSDRYRHEVVGVNSRLDEMQAALLRASLGHLEAWTERRRALAARYQEALATAGVEVPREQEYATAVWHLFVVRHDRRDDLMAGLKERGIGTLVHYPIPLHLQPAFPGTGRKGQFPVAEREAGRILSLPLYPEMTDAQVDAVIAAVRDVAPRLSAPAPPGRG
ncbi:MAG TPA: DegT/DnrJ/EryC1/StrS family aminotransferase [Vicinamibacteria bacterium]|nr:DegT/DnrJ/EryC1/StrS family aminotransferase [Vicinamibacteria bacterium]